MTLHAREVLRDCQRVLDHITGDMRTELWRPRWAGLVALLRAVGHVLKKVDGKTSDAAREVIESAWKDLGQSKPEPTIFWEFIEAERNNVLKAYEIGTGVNITVRPGTAWLNLATGETGSGPGGPTTFEAFMRSGPFEGRDPLELCREAIAFWQGYLDSIDRQVAARHTGQAV
ncbi:MAG TPA: hypothetical protein VGT06_02510 [Candidatus Methylomirabilis sp.]|jgi:hypothetical protein|nr:hypothetical protein [Candidatus Methylomirabilis sp.]